MTPIEELEHKLYDALVEIDRFTATRILTMKAAFITPLERIDKLVAPVLYRIGEEWERGSLSLAQLYMSARICENVVDTFFPASSVPRKSNVKMAIATLADHHGLGKKIVSSVLRSAGYELADLGQGLSVDELAEKVEREKISILFVSTLMLRSALLVKDLHDRLNEAGAKVRLVVGGAPFSMDPGLWKEVGADAMAGTATEALSVIERMFEEVRRK